MHPYDFQLSAVTQLDTESQADLSVKDINKHCQNYKGADTARSLYQLSTTLGLFFGLIALMFASLQISYALTVLLAVPAAGLLTRIFIFQHDCGHGSFFNSKKANTWLGRFLGLLTFTPYDFWRRAHNMHHATSGNLDSRSIGAIDTITVTEYQAMSPGKQFWYRVYRNPFFMIILGSPLYVFIGQRIPINKGTNFYENYKTLSMSSIWKSIMYTNIALIMFYGGLSYALGFAALVAVYVPVVILTSWIGAWLFYVQHQFEDAYWQEQKNWNIHEAALMGSSYFVMPRVLQWFTGNIGLHHIHHLCSQIPNYKLQQCMDDCPPLSKINVLTLRESLKCAGLHLWDEQASKMVSIKDVPAKA